MFNTGYFARGWGGENILLIASSWFDRGFFFVGGEVGKHIDCMIVYDECNYLVLKAAEKT